MQYSVVQYSTVEYLAVHPFPTVPSQMRLTAQSPVLTTSGDTTGGRVGGRHTVEKYLASQLHHTGDHSTSRNCEDNSTDSYVHCLAKSTPLQYST